MKDYVISDSFGNELVLTTNTNHYLFDSVTCSPRTDGGFGWSMLPSCIDDDSMLPTLEAACLEARMRSKVCILPITVSQQWRVFLTPTVRSHGDGSREAAKALMVDLLGAAQAPGVDSHSLLIKHFVWMKKFPATHIAGILDALKDQSRSSFKNMRVIGFEMQNHRIETLFKQIAHHWADNR